MTALMRYDCQTCGGQTFAEELPAVTCAVCGRRLAVARPVGTLGPRLRRAVRWVTDKRAVLAAFVLTVAEAIGPGLEGWTAVRAAILASLHFFVSPARRVGL